MFARYTKELEVLEIVGAEEALGCFYWMQNLSFSPDAGIQKAYSSVGTSDESQQVHAEFVKYNLLDQAYAQQEHGQTALDCFS